jgi:hypothetical protein
MGAADREIKVGWENIEIFPSIFIQVLDDFNDISTMVSLKEVGRFVYVLYGYC